MHLQTFYQKFIGLLGFKEMTGQGIFFKNAERSFQAQEFDNLVITNDIPSH